MGNEDEEEPASSAGFAFGVLGDEVADMVVVK